MIQGAKQERKSTWKWFLNFTTIGGLTQWHQSDNIRSKLAWLSLLVIGTVGTFINTWLAISDFSKNLVPIFSLPYKLTSQTDSN